MSRWRRGERQIELTYSMNVHPTDTLEEVGDSLKRYVLPLKALVYPRRRMALGLRLGAPAVEKLKATRGGVRELKEFLDRHDLYAVTMNAYPMGNFGSGRVKERVYQPDWLDEARVRYTIDCAEILAELLPAGAVGTLSTLSGAYRPSADGHEVRQRLTTHQVDVVARLDELSREDGTTVMLCLEPEPATTLERILAVKRHFRNLVYARGIVRLAERAGLQLSVARRAMVQHLGVCFDTCHQAVMYDDPRRSLRHLQEAEVGVGKMQLSSALELREPGSNTEALERLRTFDEPRYLHQVVGCLPDRGRIHAVDLPELFADPQGRWLACESWRVHFHVPIFLPSIGPLRTTQDELVAAFEEALLRGTTPHFEIETYTWDVIPPSDRDRYCGGSVIESIRREFEWVHGHLRRLGFSEVNS